MQTAALLCLLMVSSVACRKLNLGWKYEETLNMMKNEMNTMKTAMNTMERKMDTMNEKIESLLETNALLTNKNALLTERIDSLENKESDSENAHIAENHKRFKRTIPADRQCICRVTKGLQLYIRHEVTDHLSHLLITGMVTFVKLSIL